MNPTLSDELSRLRLRYIQVCAVVAILMGVLRLIGLLAADSLDWSFGNTNAVTIVSFIILNGLWLALSRTRYVRLAGYGLLTALVMGALVAPLEYYTVIALLALVTTVIVGNTRINIVVNVLVIGRIVVGAIQAVVTVPLIEPETVAVYLVPLVLLAFVSVVFLYFLNGGQRAIDSSRANADLLQATADVGQVVSQILDLDDLIENAVELIRARFKHYHVQIFMVNETRDQVLLVASTGDIGKRLLARGHQLAVGSQSVVGQVVLRGTVVVVNDAQRDAVYYHNDLLPETRAELALPIREGSQIIGVLDIQSRDTGAFGKSDVQALQITADLLATAIRNARLFKEQARTVQENERLYRESETNLREIQRLNQQLTRSAWQSYQLENRASTGVTLERDQVVPTSEWSESLIRAGQEGRVVQTENGQPRVAVPVMLRGEVIGAIEVEPGAETSHETVEMVQAVANRLALSLENARLYEATLQAAAQEQRINDIAARFQSVATVDELLRVTLAELSETLGAQHGAIRLGRFSVEQGSNPS